MKTLFCSLSLFLFLFTSCVDDPTMMNEVDPNLAVVSSSANSIDPQLPELRPDQLQADLPDDLAMIGTFGENIGTPGMDVFTDAVRDSSGNIYVTGYTAGSLPGYTNQGSPDAFAAKYNADLELVWVRQIGTASSDISVAIALHPSENFIYVAGYTSGSLQGTNAGGTDIFYSKIASDNSRIVNRQFGTSANDIVSDAQFGIASSTYITWTDTLLITGHTLGAFSGYSSAGSYDVFWAKCSETGEMMWPYSKTYTNTAYQFGTSSADYASGLYFDGSTYVFVGGETYGALEGSNAGSLDAFMRKAAYSNGALSAINQWGTAGNDNFGVMTLSNTSSYLARASGNNAHTITLDFISTSDLSIISGFNYTADALMNVGDIHRTSSNYYYISGYYSEGRVMVAYNSVPPIFTSIPEPTGITSDVYVIKATASAPMIVRGIQTPGSIDIVTKIFIDGSDYISVLTSNDDVDDQDNKGSYDGFVYGW